MQEGRLFKIIYYLLDRRAATALELAEKFEVSVRTIYRDVDALSGAGVPIYAEPGRNGGIHLMDDFVLDRAVLSEEEKQEVLTALQSLNVTPNIRANETLEKLSALFHLSSEDWLEVDFSRWGNEKYDNEKFELLKSAIVHRRSVKIFYAGSYEAAGERIVQPLKLVYKARAWYLKAFCTEKQDYRVFKLNRILDLAVLEEEFSYHPYPEESGVPQRGYNQIVLHFPKEMAYRIYDEFDRTQVERQEDGDFVVSISVPEDAWLISFLLSFGTKVDVIEPVYLKEVLAEHAKLIYEKNKT